MLVSRTNLMSTVSSSESWDPSRSIAHRKSPINSIFLHLYSILIMEADPDDYYSFIGTVDLGPCLTWTF